jgi:ATP-dependent protease Clp ATPase subunit
VDAVRILKAVDGGDMWMIERPEHLRLTTEASESIGVGPTASGSTLMATSRARV